jgi:formyltetrahydrofolate hydrolase
VPKNAKGKALTKARRAQLDYERHALARAVKTHLDCVFLDGARTIVF